MAARRVTSQPTSRKIAPLAGLICLALSAMGACSLAWAQASRSPMPGLAFQGLRSIAARGSFSAVQTDSSGNLYLLLDAGDGVRILKTDAAATAVLAEVQLGAHGDSGTAMAVSAAGDVFVSGTTTSGALRASAGAAFPAPLDSSVNSFVAGFDASLQQRFLTFTGSGQTAATSIAIAADAVFVAGSIFSQTLPVTSSAMTQTPASGSSQNGFVEKFSRSGTTLLYATYLSGLGGNVIAASIAADGDDNVYVAGYTTAAGLPTAGAIVPAMIGSGSGFLMKLAPAGDRLAFGTFVPGRGLSSVAVDTATQNILISGTIDLGAFPITAVPAPLVGTNYQVLARLPADGSAVISSTVVAPGRRSVVAPSSDGAWVAGDLATPLLPLGTLATFGDAFAIHVTQSNKVDQASRLGGLAASSGLYANASLVLTALALDKSGAPLLAGGLTLPQAPPCWHRRRTIYRSMAPPPRCCRRAFATLKQHRDRAWGANVQARRRFWRSLRRRAKHRR